MQEFILILGTSIAVGYTLVRFLSILSPQKPVVTHRCLLCKTELTIGDPSTMINCTTGGLLHNCKKSPKNRYWGICEEVYR